MILLFMIVLICVGQVFGMENTEDKIDQDYTVLVPYVVKLLQVTKEDFTPFELLASLAKPDAHINSSICCNFLSPSEHIKQIIQKKKIRMVRDYVEQTSLLKDKASLGAWFIPYFQQEIAPRMKEELKKDCAEKELREKNSSSGI